MPTPAQLIELEKMMKELNWYYEQSASDYQWRNENDKYEAILSALKQVGRKTAERLWSKYAPKNKAAAENKPMFPFPKHLFGEATKEKLKQLILEEFIRQMKTV